MSTHRTETRPASSGLKKSTHTRGFTPLERTQNEPSMTTSRKTSYALTGFTLMELLIVIGIIAILTAIVVVAINPSKQFAQARNAQRESNVATILNAIGQNIADNKGTFTCSGIGTAIDSTERTIGESDVNLSCLTPTYIPTAVPTDPDGGTENDTRYTVKVDTGRYTVCAPKHQESSVPGTTEFCLTR